MRAANVLAARVNALVFTKVASTKNEAFITEGGIRSPFKPVQNGHVADGLHGEAGLERVHARR
jgi:hypothetical protein